MLNSFAVMFYLTGQFLWSLNIPQLEHRQWIVYITVVSIVMAVFQVSLGLPVALWFLPPCSGREPLVISGTGSHELDIIPVPHSTVSKH